MQFFSGLSWGYHEIPILLTLSSDPSAGHPFLGKRKVEKAMKKMGEAVMRAEQEEWESHGQGLINEPLI